MRLVAAGTVVAIVAFANSIAGLPPPPGAADVASATAAGAEAAIGRTPAAPEAKLADRMVEPMLEVAAESLARLACTGDTAGGSDSAADGASAQKGAAKHCSEATATAIREDMVRDGAHDTMLHVCRLSRRPPALKAATRALAAMAAPRVNRSALNDASAVGVLSRLVGRVNNEQILESCAAAIVRLTAGGGQDGALPPAVELLCRQWCERNMTGTRT